MTLICGNQLGQKLEPLRHQIVGDHAETSNVAAWFGRSWDQPLSTGSLPVIKTTGIAEFAIITARIETSPLTAAITSTLRRIRSAANTGSRSKLAFRPAMFKSHRARRTLRLGHPTQRL